MDVEFRLDERTQVNSRMRFLIIDDSVTMRRIIANILARLGYPEVVHAANGREALDRLAAETVDVVITDWYMPEMNGLDFVKTLRNTPATSHIPIVIVTANAASDDIQHALELGVKGYILKPFTVETMKDKIDALIGQMAPPSPAADGEPASVTAGAEMSIPPVEAETGLEPEPAVEAAPGAESEPAIESESDFHAPADLIAAPAGEPETEPSVVA
jgi:two-component system chemotaxis response regulator CheY